MLRKILDDSCRDAPCPTTPSRPHQEANKEEEATIKKRIQRDERRRNHNMNPSNSIFTPWSSPRILHPFLEHCNVGATKRIADYVWYRALLCLLRIMGSAGLLP